MGTDNASGALKFAVGLVVTMILIGIIVVAFTFGRTHANNAISSTSKDISSIEESRYTMYDGVTVTGAEVLNLIKKFEADNIAVSVTTTGNPLATVTSYDSTQTGTTFYVKDSLTGSKRSTTDEAALVRDAKDTTNAAYINPSAEFYGIVNYATDTGAIQGISFFRIEG